MYELVDRYITNVDDIMPMVYDHEQRGMFTNRGIGGTDTHETKYGESHFSSLYEKDMDKELIDTVWKTVPEEERKWCSQIVINKYKQLIKIVEKSETIHKQEKENRKLWQKNFIMNY